MTGSHLFSLGFLLLVSTACAPNGAGDSDMDITGRAWVVEDIAGGGVIDSSRVTMEFSGDGRLSGSGGCNNYSGDYTLDGEAISIGPVASTKKACAPAIMNQEARFFAVLSAASRISITDDGALTLISEDLGAVTARR